jgi:tripartite-type tricarboxylate transporter receptor subunit TctC
MPKTIVNKLSTLIAEIVHTPDVRQKLFVQGWQMAGTSAEGLATRIKHDTALLGGIIQMRGIKTQ